MEKYEEALAKARAGKPLEEIFPEMKESDDERIRKIITLALIVSEEQLSAFYSVHNITRKECTDWLKKQKEQKPAELEQLAKLKEMTHEIRDAYEKGIESWPSRIKARMKRGK